MKTSCSLLLFICLLIKSPRTVVAVNNPSQVIVESRSEVEKPATAVLGTVSSLVAKLKRIKLRQLKGGFLHAFHVGDIILLSLTGFLTEPFAKATFDWWYQRTNSYHNNSVPIYKKSLIAKAAEFIREIAQVATVVYVFDMATMVGTHVGFLVPAGLNDKFAKVIYTLYGAYRARRVQHWWMRTHLFQKDHHSNAGKHKLVQLVLDSALVGVTLIVLIHDVMSVTISKGVQSLFALGGFAGILLSLAAKDLANMLLSGFMINSGDKFDVGESIELGDGTKGTVADLGAFDMHIRGPDGVVTRIPNGQVANQRVRNLSRTGECMVHQELWFSYDDMDRMPQILEAIKQAIIEDCPKLIKDGRRAFHVVWTGFAKDHLDVTVQASFDIPPTGDEYHLNRQSVMQAIARGVKSQGVDFAIPTSICKTQELNSDGTNKNDSA
jgi:small-conductance mechanosensitive channel